MQPYMFAFINYNAINTVIVKMKLSSNFFAAALKCLLSNKVINVVLCSDSRLWVSRCKCEY